MKIKAAHDRGEPGKDIKMPPLVWKNMYRLARSLHFGNAEDAEVHYPLHLIEKKLEESREYGPMATKMREQLNYYLVCLRTTKSLNHHCYVLRFKTPTLNITILVRLLHVVVTHHFDR